MATDNKTAKPGANEPKSEDWRRRESFGGFIRDVLIAAVILGVGLWIYRGNVETGKKVRALGKEAKELMLKDAPQAYVQAEKRLLDMIALDKSYPFAVSSLAELYEIRWLDFGMDGEAAKAHEWAAKAKKLDSNINERFGAAILEMLGDKKYADAEKYATEISSKAASSHVVNGLGRAFRMQGKLGEAKVALKRSADTEWRNPRFACDMADVYFEDGDYMNAQAFYSKGIEANSEHARSLVGRSRAQIARNFRVMDAGETLREVLERPADQLAPKTKSQGLTGVAELMLLQGRPDDALKFAEQAISTFAGNPWAYFVKGRALATNKDMSAAAAFDKAIELDKYVPEFYYGASKAMQSAGDANKALALLDAYRGALKEDDRYFLAYGTQLAAMDRDDEALKFFDKAIDFNNFNAQAIFAKGTLLFDKKKDVENAKKAFDNALEIQEYYPEAHVKLGDILFNAKEWADGCQEYAQALVQMKQLQQPRERMSELRELINTRLIKEAKQKDVAKAWMEETGAMVR